MQIHLEQLPHQESAISAVIDAMRHCRVDTGASTTEVYANPTLKRTRGIDVKMETGTGKTYVYTRLMHEIYKAYGVHKFIIMTPSLPIKEGTRNFITSQYSRQHFRELFPDQKINLSVINAGDFTTKKGKRRQFSGALSEFCEASSRDIGTVNALLMNDAMLGSVSMSRDDYDQTLIGGSSSPLESLALTRPVVIIDEPHRFRRDGVAWANILKLNPQLIIRFGATFPDISRGPGRQKVSQKDYDNLVYDLTAVDSFNQGLVKAIDVNFPHLPEHQAAVKYRVESATNRELVLKRDGRRWTLGVGDDLSMVDPGFEGDVTYVGKRLSNELEVSPGMLLVPGTWGNSYQEMMLRQAIDAHFDNERKLFYRPANLPRIKTLSLFFIDSIASYRNEDGWLKRTFERILEEKLTQLIRVEAGEYKDFLEATLASLRSDIQDVHAGYFAEDTHKKGDEAIQQEIDDILRGKARLLQFRDEVGRWNTRRFLFSKWTLREGWDNPNVFVLTKLRSSGSEASKLQEVGRGLRLPVDELGNRVSDEEFRLHLLVDYSEKDFASHLVGEINADGGKLQEGKIGDEVLDALVASGYALDRSAAKKKLLLEDIIDFDLSVLNADALESLVPLGVTPGKVRVNARERPLIHLRKENWEKVTDLWQAVSRRYMMRYGRLTDEEIGLLVDVIFRPGAFSDAHGRVTRMELVADELSGSITLQEKVFTVEQHYGSFGYGEFLRRVHQGTNIPINLLHKGVVRALGESSSPARFFNDLSVHNITQLFREKFIELFAERHTYHSLDYMARVSLFDKDGALVDKLDQNVVGLQAADDVVVSENYLYDRAVYDSELEHEILKESLSSEVLVFGKLPRRSIKVPTFTGGTTSPDFVYALRDRKTGAAAFYVLIEAKGKESTSLTTDEAVALLAQEKMSDELSGDVEFRLVTRPEQVSEVIEGLLGRL